MDTAKIFLGLAAACWLGWAGYTIWDKTETQKLELERQVKALKVKQDELEEKLSSAGKSKNKPVEETNRGDENSATDRGVSDSSESPVCKKISNDGTVRPIQQIVDAQGSLDLSHYFSGTIASVELDDNSRNHAKLDEKRIKKVKITVLKPGKIFLILKNTQLTQTRRCSLQVTKSAN